MELTEVQKLRELLKKELSQSMRESIEKRIKILEKNKIVVK